MAAIMGRNAYQRDSLETASPGRIIVMLYDRAVKDLVVAEDALERRDFMAANEQLQHAQEILLELYGMLDLQAWSGAPYLANLYVYLVGELVKANVEHDATKIVPVREMLVTLADTWREAHAIAGGQRNAVAGTVVAHA